MISATSPDFTLATELGQGGVKQKFWVPASWTRTLSSVNYFNTVANAFDAANKLSDFTVTSTTIGGVSYNQYTYNGLERGSLRIRLNFT
jgi:hypothetical protein